MLPDQDAHKLSKAESARINGAKSSGPTTPEGKANSANGNLKHGAYSSRVVMDDEDPAVYENFKTCFLDHFNPRDPFEAECVGSMVTARWRIRRLESSETANLNIALAENKEANAARFEPLNRRHERAIAVHSQMDAIEKSTRVEERLNRIYERNYKLLAIHRRKPGLSLPTPPAREEDVAPPEPASPPASPDLTDDPNLNVSPAPSAAPLTAILTIFLLIFAILLLTPIRATAEQRAAWLPVPAFYASPRTFHPPNHPGLQK